LNSPNGVYLSYIYEKNTNIFDISYKKRIVNIVFTIAAIRIGDQININGNLT